MKLTPTDINIISTLSADLPQTLTPFQHIADRLGVPRQELLSRVEQFRRSRLLRRFGAIVDHRKIGFTANAMAVWRIPQEMLEDAARVVASSSAVTHCYERETRPTWPYNLYAMLHAKTREQCEKVAHDISRSIPSRQHLLLFTVREFKRLSPDYFSSAQRE